MKQVEDGMVNPPKVILCKSVWSSLLPSDDEPSLTQREVKYFTDEK